MRAFSSRACAPNSGEMPRPRSALRLGLPSGCQEAEEEWALGSETQSLVRVGRHLT